MNKRPFLLGLGIGLIVGAALLQLMLVGQQQAEGLDNYNKDIDSAGSKLYTQEELDSKLAEESKRIRAEEQKRTQEQQEKEQQKARQDNEQKDASTQPEATKSDKPEDSKNTTSDKQTQTGESEAANKAAEQETAADSSVTKSTTEPSAAKQHSRIIVRIVPGSDLTETAALLHKQGVIQSQKQFITLMRKASNKIRAGYFAFEGDLTLQQVKKIVTGQPMDPEAAKNEMKR